MKAGILVSFAVAICCMGYPPFAQAQTSSTAPKDPFTSEKALFGSEEVFDITLKGKVRDVLNDRAVDSKYHPLVLAYKNEDSTEINIPVEVKTRGHFRKLRANCFYPPLQIKFAKKEPQTSSVFGEQSKLKLVMPCKGEEFIIREWLAYKLYNLVTEKSFRARLVRVKLEDERSKKPSPAFYGML
ncbi:MAG: hypothetical protein SFU87_20190, partial [Chitinophagaceae bacterium]|nr:hypothetical protein [Chitinophagaceae bacterium]